MGTTQKPTYIDFVNFEISQKLNNSFCKQIELFFLTCEADNRHFLEENKQCTTVKITCVTGYVKIVL